MTGAAQLCSTAALRAGAGYVRLTVPGVEDPPAPIEAVVLGARTDDWDRLLSSDASRFGCVAIGPGLGRDAGSAARVRAALAATDRPVVLDGDGLAAIADAPTAALHSRPVVDDVPAPTVLTPHDGEFEMLTGAPPGEDRVDAARALAATTGAVVLLKGPTTVVAEPDGDVLLVRSGDERLATAGTGDVLTGTIAALIASGALPVRAAAAGAHLHGRAAELGPRRGLVASDVADALPDAWADLLG